MQRNHFNFTGVVEAMTTRSVGLIIVAVVLSSCRCCDARCDLLSLSLSHFVQYSSQSGSMDPWQVGVGKTKGSFDLLEDIAFDPMHEAILLVDGPTLT
ncbi:hypothetical protein GGR54DRAFT_560126 [Hypoxylon sp. NC1633]|nr:hypothetical protein GGR54DRAFT_560126 [Hypoxylon sp. NC1633]